MRIPIVATSLLLSAALTSTLTAEHKVSRKNVPLPVQQAIDRLTQSMPGAELRELSKEREHGQTVYEISLRVNGKTRDVTVDPQGQTVLTEQEVEWSSLPVPVQEGLRREAGKGRILLVESITKGTTVTYEGHVKGWPKKEIVVDGSGALVPPSSR